MKRAAPLVLLMAAVLSAVLLLRSWRASEAPVSPRNVAAPSSTTTAPRAEATRQAAILPSPVSAETPAAQPSPAPSTERPARREDVDRLIAEGKVLEGLEVFRKVVGADPTAKNHGELGSLLYRLTAFDEAAVHLRAAAELDPGNADRWVALANVYYRKVNPGEAWKAERRAREAEHGLELGRDNEGMRVRKGEAAPRNP